MLDGAEPIATGRPKVDLDPREPALAGFRRVLRHLASTIQATTPGVLAHDDPEQLHALRVAVRRTRSLLQAGKGVLPADVRTTRRADFAWLGSITGPARDLDVLLIAWRGDIRRSLPGFVDELAPLLASVEQARRLAHDELDHGLRSSRYVDLLGTWTTWLAGTGGDHGEPLGPLVARRIERAHRRVVTGGRAITEASPGEDLHDLRKASKRLRYLLECFGGMLPKAERKRVLGSLKRLQATLGDHQDAEVQLDLLATYGPASAAATNALRALLDGRRGAARAEFADQFAAFDTAATAAAVDAMLRPLR